MGEYDDINEIVEENENKQFLFGKQKINFNEITDSFKFKTEMLKIDEAIQGLMSKDIINANFTDAEKKKAFDFLSLANDCAEFNLPEIAYSYYRDVLLISGISRGYKGFQQEKFVETRDVRESRINAPKNKWWRGKN